MRDDEKKDDGKKETPRKKPQLSIVTPPRQVGGSRISRTPPAPSLRTSLNQLLQKAPPVPATALHTKHNELNIDDFRTPPQAVPVNMPAPQPILATRIPFPTDYEQLEKFSRRLINRPWYQYRKVSYPLALGSVVIIAWVLYEALNGSLYFREKYYPAYSDATRQDLLFSINERATLSFLAILIFSSVSGYLLGRWKDPFIDRQGNRQLIGYLIDSTYLVDSTIADANLDEYRINIELLHKHLPHYFNSLLLKRDWKAVIAVILAVANYIDTNEIVNKLAKQEKQKTQRPIDSNNMGIDHKDEEEKKFNPDDKDNKDDKDDAKISLQQKQRIAAEAGIAALTTQRAVFISGGISPIISIPSTYTRAVVGEYDAMLKDHEKRLRDLENRLSSNENRTSPAAVSYVDAEFVRKFPALLLEHCKLLMSKDSLTFRIPPKQRASVWSHLFNTADFTKHATIYINAIFPSQAVAAIQPVDPEDLETFAALPYAHQLMIIKKVNPTRITTTFWNPSLNNAQRNTLLCQLVNDHISKNNLSQLLTSREQPYAANVDGLALIANITRTANFFNHYPITAGIALSSLLDTNPTDSHINLAFDIFWHPDISNLSRKKIITEIENRQPAKSLKIFGMNASGDALKPNMIAIIQPRNGLYLLGEVIEESFLGKLQKLQAIINKKQAKDPHADVTQLRAGFPGLSDGAYRLTNILLSAQPADLTPLAIQKNLISVLHSTAEFLYYDARVQLVNSILLQFFGGAGRFNLQLASSLAAFCTHENIIVATVFDNLRDDPRLGVDAARNDTLNRFAAVLIYAYQAGVNANALFHSRQTKQQSKDNIQAVFGIMDYRNCTPLTDAFKELELFPIVEIVNQLTAGYNYVDLANRDGQRQPLLQAKNQLDGDEKEENGFQLDT